MKLSKAAILALKGLDLDARKRISAKLTIAPSTLYRWIASNHGNLTKAASIKAISEEIGLTEDQILEEEQIKDDAQNNKLTSVKQ